MGQAERALRLNIRFAHVRNFAICIKAVPLVHPGHRIFFGLILDKLIGVANANWMEALYLPLLLFFAVHLQVAVSKKQELRLWGVRFYGTRP